MPLAIGSAVEMKRKDSGITFISISVLVSCILPLSPSQLRALDTYPGD
jgi:hypothetical protein